MATKAVTSALGLYRTPNPLGGAQDGGYSSLQNCVIRSKDVIEPRRGQSQVASYINNNRSDMRRINALFCSSVGTLAQYGSGSTSGVALLETLSTAILTNVDPPSVWSRTKFADCMKRAYFTTATGIKRVTSAGVGAAAGGLRAKIDTSNSHAVYDTSGQLAANSACMYRAELVSFAPDGAEIVGPPSNRFYCRTPAQITIDAGAASRVANVITITFNTDHYLRVGDSPHFTWDAGDTGATKFTTGTYTVATVPSKTQITIANTAANYSNLVAATMEAGPASASVKVLLPSTVSTSDLLRIYRSEQVTGVLGSPSDDVYQVFEAYITSAQVSAGYVTVSDNTPEVLLGDPSYFSPSVEGEGQANETPLCAQDICALGDTLFGFNLLDSQSLEVRLIATGGSTGVADGTTFTINRSGYNSISVQFITGPLADERPIVYTGGTVARDIEATALALVDSLNTATDNNWLDVLYESALGDAPGKILLRARDFSTTAFTVTCTTKPTAWAPNLPNTGTVTTSKQVPDIAGFAWAKSGQPDAWPATQRGRIGSPSETLLRGIALREKIVCLKENSAHLISGVPPQIRVDPLEDSISFPLPDTAAVLDNQVMCLSSVGVVAVSEAGVAKMGTPIEGDTRAVVEQALRLKSLIAASCANIHCLASWAAVDVIDGRYLLAIPSAVGTPSATPAATQQVDNIWVYNSASRAWTGPWPMRHRHAAAWKGASASGRLVFARADIPGVLKEQGLDGDSVAQFSDYFGDSLTVTFDVNNDTANRVTITNTSGLQSGDALYVSATGFAATILAVGVGYVDVDDWNGLTTGGTVLVLKGYECRAEPVSLTGDGFPSEKQAHSIHWALADARFNGGTDAAPTASVVAFSESSPEKVARVLHRKGMGSSPLGAAPLGDSPALLKERAPVPMQAQRGLFHSIALKVREAGAYWRLHALGLEFEPGSSKGVK